MEKIYSIILGASFFLISSCGTITTDRTFGDQMDNQLDPFFTPGRDFPAVMGDTGKVYNNREETLSRIPATNDFEKKKNQDKVSLAKEIKKKEDNLSEEERANYNDDATGEMTESERNYYLSLPINDRFEYLSSRRGMGSIDNKHLSVWDRRAMKEGSVFMGMSKGAVLQSWGRPHRVDIAGNPSNQNEKWIYFEGNRIKYVYFEKGVVQGWNQDLE